jgi:translocation and assembly module TamA
VADESAGAPAPDSASAEAPAEPPAKPPRVGRVKVEVEGEGENLVEVVLGGELSNNNEARVSIEQARKDELTPARLRQLHSRAPEEIERALEPFGYYRPRVRSELVQQGTDWTARYRVDPGPRMKLEAVDVEVRGPGADDPGFVERVRGFPLAPGEALSHSAYEAGKDALVGYAAGNGYLDAAFETSEIRVDLDRYTASIDLELDTGPRYLFGPARFHQTALEPSLLRGYVTFEPGEPLDVDELAQLQDALSDSPYFQRVEVVPRQEEAEGLRVPIDVDLVAAARQKWDLGVGYGTDTGPRATVGLELRRINRRGHRGEGEVTVSEIENSFTTRYLVPGAYPRTDVVTYTLGYSRLEPDTSVSETALAGAGLTRSRGRWREAFGLTFQRADFEVGVDSGISELLIPEASWSRVEADDRIYPLTGRRYQFKVRAADASLGSDSSFVQATAEAKLVRSLGGGVRLIGRAGVGELWTSDFRDLPPAIRFFAGGDQSVRGYGYQELGELDVEGHVIGGETLATASLEADALFLDFGRFGRWGAAAFYDVGGAAESLGDRLEQGAGVGLRWLSPIGLVRADVAWAVSEPGAPLRFHLMIGPDL